MEDIKDHVRALLLDLIVDSLGPQQVSGLLDDVSIKVFSAFLLSEGGRMRRKEEYTPRIFSNPGGFPYFRPDGWVQVRLTAADQDPDFAELKGWPVAYHGTDSSKLGPILEAGLRKPGEVPSVLMVHGNAGAGPAGAIYVSPSLWYAAHPVYSTLLQLLPDHWVQFAFKLRVRPGSFFAQPSTLSRLKWSNRLQIDPNLQDNQALEWVVSSSKDVFVVGLMIRELGGAACAQVYGEMARNVVGISGKDPEFVWTDSLQESFSAGGYEVYRGELCVGFTSAEWTFDQWWFNTLMCKSASLDSAQFLLRRFRLEGHLRATKSDEVLDFAWYMQACDLPAGAAMLLEVAFGTQASRRMLCRRALDEAWEVNFDAFQVREETSCVVARAVAVPASPGSLRLDLVGNAVSWLLDERLLMHASAAGGSCIFSDSRAIPTDHGHVTLHLALWPQIEGWPDWCGFQALFTGGPRFGFAYTLRMGSEVLEQVHGPEDGLETEMIWAPRAQACSEGILRMQVEVSAEMSVEC